METTQNFRMLLVEHHAFYEVAPHYVVVDERRGTQRVQDGFDVFVYGVKNEHDESFLSPPHSYALAYEGLQRIAERVATEISHSCAITVMPLPGTVVLNPRDDAKITAVLVVRIARWGTTEAAGPPETHALEAVEHALKAAGLKRR
jgi:hypothetical protein